MASLTEKNRNTQEIADRYWDNAFQTAQGKIAVLVEGDDDKYLLEAVLSSHRPGWETSLGVIAAGSRENVLKRLTPNREGIRFPSGYGLVDRDTWDDAEVAAEQEKLPARLYVTSGWCIENLFLDPLWLERYYPVAAAQLESEREQWVRAGALWWSLQRAREAQQAWQQALGWDYGKPPPVDRSSGKAFDLSSGDTVAQELLRRIPEETRQRASFDEASIGQRFQERCDALRALPFAEQWQQGVHGKKAFRELLVPALQTRGTTQPENGNWRVELARKLDRPLPAPLDTLVALVPA
uniref:Putative cytoplasmic protein n=1 Tax=uncultured bacterium A1Q1_fos_565 TaxID=1256585 RepID=L7VZS9_9BACT|nr:putative cytoplasmic protein [uncultured bacterium A1Q1_fos_565]